MTLLPCPFADAFTATAASAEGKPPFSILPPRLLRDLCSLASADSIVSTRAVAGGVSASAAYIVAFDNGRRFFVKGSHPADQSHGAANLRGECAAYQALPILQDVAPAYGGMVFDDTGDDQGWWLGAWQAVDVVDTLYDVAASFALLDRVQYSEVPAAAGLPVASAHPYLSQFFNDTYKWRRLSDDVTRLQKFTQCFDDVSNAQAWCKTALPALLSLQAQAATQSFRLGLMHGDLRCDNYIYGSADAIAPRWWMIDWANAAEGPLLFDRAMLASSLLVAGRVDVATAAVLAQGDHPVDDYKVMLATLSGYFADQIYRAAPAPMPRLRPMQKAMFWGLVALLHAADIAPPLPDLKA